MGCQFGTQGLSEPADKHAKNTGNEGSSRDSVGPGVSISSSTPLGVSHSSLRCPGTQVGTGSTPAGH